MHAHMYIHTYESCSHRVKPNDVAELTCGYACVCGAESMHLAFQRADGLIPDQVDELNAPGIIYRYNTHSYT